MKRLFLGLDTSNYTTSCALCDQDGNILLNQKMLLPVHEGQRGLRQSDAVFLHVKHLQDTADNLRQILRETDGVFTAVGYSRSPRDTQESYMPCFLVGSGVGEMISAVMNVPAYNFSHQAGHLMAAARSACRQYNLSWETFIRSPFLAFHVSGGTTDILYARPDEKQVLLAERIGGTLDINAGQLIDRIGVQMGLSFPCGAILDKMAKEYRGKIPKAPLAIRGLECNLSGLENKADALYRETADCEKVSAYVIHAVGETLYRFTQTLREQYPNCPILYAGGVMSSGYIREQLCHFGMFADAEYSSDNAAGTALLTLEAWKRREI